jgi:deazaflavin-dependent oxidoreductase (nitroreductase family)
MAKTPPVPRYVRWANVMTTTLLRAGIKLTGPGGAPMYLLTVRGRNSGLPRTTPIATIEQEGRRYILTPYGVVDWVRNLRAAGIGTLTRGQRAEPFRAIEVPTGEASRVLQAFMATGNPIGRFFAISATAAPEEYERLALTHPVFMVQSVA